MRYLKKVRTFLLLPKEARQLALHAIFLPPAITAAFRLAGVSRTQKYLRVWALRGSVKCRPSEAGEVISAVRRSQALARRATGIEGSCLVRSLTLWVLLLRRGVETDLRLGIRKKEGRTEGHAWIEWAGKALNERQELIDTYHVYRHPVSFDAQLIRRDQTGSSSEPSTGISG